MLKQLLLCLKKFLKLPFGRKQAPSLNPDIKKVVEPLPELTNADLEFLFTQLLEGVHQARGRQWAIKYLQRMENRISNQRWIDWLLNFGEKLLLSPAPNNQLGMRMVQLGELGIGTIGELAHDIGVSLLTRNLGESNLKNDVEDAEAKVYTSILTSGETFNSDKQYQDPVMPLARQEKVIWKYDTLDTEAIKFAPPFIPQEIDGKRVWVENSPETAVVSNESLTYLEPKVANTLDELLVKLKQSSHLAEELASKLDVQTTHQLQTPLEQAQAWFYQGLQQAKRNELLQAIISYDKAIEINPNSYEYWFNRGLALFYLEHFVEAIASYDKAIEIKPNFYKGWYNRGCAQGELGYFEDAVLSFNKAIEIKFDYHEAWSSRGLALVKLGYVEDGISSYDQALLVQPQEYENWYYRGIALATSGRIHDAIASYEKAIELNPEFHFAWYYRGVELSNLGEFEDASASLQQAVEINPDSHEGWYALGCAQDKLGQREEAIASYNHAIQINPDFHDAFIDKGVVLSSLGRWHEAILSWQQALEKKPDFYLTWFNQAVAFENMGHRSEAIASYEKAIELNPDFHLAWYNRGVSLFYLGRFEEAIASYDNALQIQPDYWEAWIARGTAAGDAFNYDSDQIFVSAITATNSNLNQRGYEGKLASYEEGLRYVYQSTYPEGWGRLHLLLGNAHYERGKRDFTPRHYWIQSVAEYYQAMETLTPDAFPQLHLEVLLNLIKTFLSLGETAQAQEFHHCATDLLQYLLSDPEQTDESKKAIALKFAGFGQLAVDIAVQSGELAQALEIAEYSKNACLSWLLYGWRDEIISPSYTSMQKLLNPTTAIIYWFISPYGLRTFIVKYKSPEPIPVFTPVLNVADINEMPLPETLRVKGEFEDWLQDWNEDYQDYCSTDHDKENNSNHSWRATMEQRLLNLKKILNINAIIEELENINYLILIPHLELHRFPLHALFDFSYPLQQQTINSDGYYSYSQSFKRNFTTSYLPSIQIGLSLKDNSLLPIRKQPLLSFEHPNTTDYLSLKFGQLESEVISHIFDNVRRFQGSKATKKNLENSLSNNYKLLHFQGDITNNFSEPQKSELVLAGDDKLTLEEIYIHQIENYNLVTLSTSETSIFSDKAITTEYVGLVSGLLSQGVSHVLSTLWSVEPGASTLVMIEFYRQMQQHESAAIALSAATTWLKDVTASDLKKWCEDLLKILPHGQFQIRTYLATEVYRKFSKMPGDKKLYNHPYYWAGFTITGKRE
ncbi:tetratricopeptide repeat protein [Aetokthonos hydrillicola Thurmond2011]|jgi:tetratricopeptide (TPR) repeat protein/CHAT domain-containing protein|uniref:Tetratricopeptide repeat protein n=1 Tax=Aetokthonos hydrillicola Thurmond2011 TaxID=2712845 RepID=A0AAP5I263_9CYAN|nr:tetratricopeptide repeat protein [Aetokthonos hydrillicola]MBO3462794.1 tetratricopeptide repeat protein [Aetokthonos hydrillicola CCALA 1050]MBW4590191.1 tetratricopeptide repeat protein [Aetokthonos hydrillicola CCALA 1050]MDR9893335.1 tetratricopeptide repeat protein [Aetokthonos hydrillicola Thurmond2011]